MISLNNIPLNIIKTIFIAIFALYFILFVRSITTYHLHKEWDINVNEVNDMDNKIYDNELIIGVPFHCSKPTNYWFTRLFSNILLIQSPPRYMFIVMSNKKSKECNYDEFYNVIINITEKRTGMKIFFYKRAEKYIASLNRNFIIDKINQRFNVSKNLIISFTDCDDFIHPEKFKLMNKFYENHKINGTILHTGNITFGCKTFEDKYETQRYDSLFQHLHELNENLIEQFLINESQFILKRWSEFFDASHMDYNMSDICTLLNTNNINPNLTFVPFTEFDNYLYKYMNNMYKRFVGNGWITTTLNVFNSNPMPNISRGEDQVFNYLTIIKHYDFYVCKPILSVYCWGWTTRSSFPNIF
eukprot:215471_1